MVFAVIKTGGKQYKVAEGGKFLIELLPQKVGEEFDFNEVLLIADQRGLNADSRGQDSEGGNGIVRIGRPLVEGAKVHARVLENGKAKKKIIFKFKNKTRYWKKKGHRQPFTKVEILKITA